MWERESRVGMTRLSWTRWETGKGREEGRMEREEPGIGARRPKVQKEGEGSPRLDYVGKSLWGKGSPAPGLESSGFKVKYAGHTL